MGEKNDVIDNIRFMKLIYKINITEERRMSEEHHQQCNHVHNLVYVWYT